MTSHRNSPVASDPGILPGQGLAAGSRRELLSAYMDGEAGAGEMPHLAAFLDEREGRETWDIYHLVGDAIRTPELATPVSGGFHARFLSALEQEPAIIAAPRSARRLMGRYGFPGLAAAAAVASVTWIAQPYFGGHDAAAPQYAANLQGRAANVVPASLDVDGPDVSLGEYLDAHRQIAGRSAIRRVSETTIESEASQR